MRVPGAIVAAWLAILAALPLSGCRTSGSRAEPAPRPAARAVLGPVEAHRAARLERALTGLVFENGRVRPADGAPAPGPANERHRIARALLTEGQDQLAAGRRIEALERFARAVLTAPDLPQAYVELGHGLRYLGKTGEALAAFDTALALEPRQLGALSGRARVLELQGRFPEAIEQWHEVLAYHPDHGPAHIRLATDLHYTGDREAAIEHLDAAPQGTPVPPQLRTLLVTGRPPRAATRRATAGASGAAA